MLPVKHALYLSGIKGDARNSVVVQWLRLHAPNIGSLSSNPDQGTKSYILQLKVHMPQVKKKIPHATIKIKNPACYN